MVSSVNKQTYSKPVQLFTPFTLKYLTKPQFDKRFSHKNCFRMCCNLSDIKFKLIETRQLTTWIFHKESVYKQIQTYNGVSTCSFSGWKNPLQHIPHLYGEDSCGRTCICVCLRQLPRSVNVFPHTPQLYGFSPTTNHCERSLQAVPNLWKTNHCC